MNFRAAAWIDRLKELHDRGSIAAAIVASHQQQQQQQQHLGSGDDANSDTSANGTADASRVNYTSRTTGQSVSMDLCVVCGDRASG